MDLLVPQSIDCDYKGRNNNLSNEICDFVSMESNLSTVISSDTQNTNNLKFKSKQTRQNGSSTDYEKMLYFVCNLCPYLCVKDSKITEHLENDHKDNKPSSKPLQMKCPACPNIFYRNTSLKSHLIHDHKVDSSDLRQIVQAVIYYAKKSSNTTVTKSQLQPALQDTRSEIDMSLIEKLMNNDECGNNEYSFSKEQEVVNCNVYENPIGQVQVIKDLRLKDVEMVDKIEVKSLRMTTLPATETPPNNLKDPTLTPIINQKKPDTFSKFLDQKKMHKCTISQCKVLMVDLDNLKYHVDCHFANTFKCPECNEIFSFWKPLTAHLWRIHKVDMELYSCDKCDYKCPSLGKLNNSHKLIHSELRAFECDECKKKFKNTKQLRNHKVIHKNKTKRYNHTCETCTKAFSDKRQLTVHMDVVHKNIRPFLCSYCGYKGASKSTLKMHIRQHTGEKPYSCDACEYTTSDHNSMRRHKLRHTGHKPYKCAHCNYACIQATTYKEHIRAKHPGMEKDFVFTCQECQFRSINQHMYLSHLFLVHQQKPV